MRVGGGRPVLAGFWVVVVLVSSGCSEPEDPVERKAFFAAATALQAAPAVRYTTDLAGARMEMRATRDGAATGTLTFAGMRLGLLTVGGKSYVRWQKGSPIGGVSPEEASLANGKWITGGADTRTTTPILTPSQLGVLVTEQLKQSKTVFPRRGTTATVDGVQTWKAATPGSDIYITRKAPHRVVRISPKGTVPGLPPMPTLPSDLPSLPSDLPSLPELGLNQAAERASRSSARRSRSAPTPVLPGRVDLSPMDQQQVDELFDDLVKNTRQLTASFDLSYQLTAQGSAAFTGCGPAACNVSVKVNSTFTSKNVRPPRKIDATMDVTMTGDGAPAGGCSTTGTLPVNGTGTLNCTNSSPAWTAWYARASQQRGTHIYIANTRVLGRAITEADIDRLLEELHRLQEEYQRNLRPTSSPSDGCTPQPATYGPLDDRRGTSGHAVLCDPPPTGSDAGVQPRGYNAAEHDAGHLIGARFGGSGTTVANVVTLYRRMNQVVMRTCENRVADLVKAEAPVDYTVTANYSPGKVIPDSITMVAKGSKGTLFSKTIPNTKSARHECLK